MVRWVCASLAVVLRSDQHGPSGAPRGAAPDVPGTGMPGRHAPAPCGMRPAVGYSVTATSRGTVGDDDRSTRGSPSSASRHRGRRLVAERKCISGFGLALTKFGLVFTKFGLVLTNGGTGAAPLGRASRVLGLDRCRDAITHLES